MRVITDNIKRERALRGQYAQAKIQQFLKATAERNALMDWERIYDARSSRGRIPARPGDYCVFAPGKHIWIEVKETRHTSRIARSKIPQIPKLRIREMAGGTIIVLIYHSTLKKWRVPTFEILKRNPAAVSWDLSGLTLYETVEQAMIAAGQYTNTKEVWKV